MVKIKVPATTANLGCGYDTFGLSLGYYNYITVEPSASQSLQIIGEGSSYLHKAATNLVIKSAAAAYEQMERAFPPLSFICENNIPLSRGMGSSSSAIVGGIFAANELMGKPMSAQQMLDLATKIEGHPDNVAPALLGGFTISVNDGAQYFTKKVQVNAPLKAILAIPDFQLSTKKARAIMPKQVALEDAVFNLGHGAYLAVSLAEGDLQGFGAMLDDKLHQPYRFTLIAGAEDVVSAAIAAGALGCVISGSGPTMVSFSEDDQVLNQNIAAAMSEAFANHNIAAKMMVLDIDNHGTQVCD